VDLSIDNVKWYKINSGEPALAKSIEYEKKNRISRQYISNIRNKKEIKEAAVEKDKSLLDFYDEYDPLKVTPLEEKKYKEYLKSLSEEEKGLLKTNYNYYEISLSNIGGMVMPVILEFEYLDGSKEVKRIPAEIWSKNNDYVTKIFITKKEVRYITLDPFLETADVNTRNNVCSVQEKPDYFKVKKYKRPSSKNLMQQFKKKK